MMAKILAAVNLSLSTQVVPNEDHDDALWEHEQQRSPAARKQIKTEQDRLAREAMRA